ncbi:DUF6118 family protein [Brucella rhizosphaerae]|uniref:DUF6118 family protein n=1 Tax=Brucella rhizosphaerae TaxID=571254 RepID=UPI00363C1ADA
MAELDDDREENEPEALDEDAGDPAAAFDALRRTIETQGAQIGAEMTVMRRGLEAAFDQLERIEPQADYKPQLASSCSSSALSRGAPARRRAIAHSPAGRATLCGRPRAQRRGPDTHAAAQALERQASDLERACRNLAAHTKSAYDRKGQDFRMSMAGLVGLFVGIFLILLLPRFLPFSADSHVASLVMGYDRVSAGRAMIEAADPEARGGHRDGRVGL